MRQRLSGFTTRWTSSLRWRVITTVVVIGGLIVVGIGWFATQQVQRGLFEQRLEQILQESAASITAARNSMDVVTVSHPSQVHSIASDLLQLLQSRTPGEKYVYLLPTLGSTVGQNVELTSKEAEAYRDLISAQLRDAVQEDADLRWQSVNIPDDVTSDPGIMVGASLTIPGAGDYELYFLYSLASEQQTLSFVQQIIIIVTILLSIVMVSLTWFLVNQTVEPVQAVSRAAERLAHGNLHERLTVKGQDEFAVLAASFNEMADSLEDQIVQMAELGLLQRRFVSDVSHELRTPLTTMRMAGDMIYSSREDMPQHLARPAELLHDQLDRFEALLADLLEISRIDAGNAQLDTEELDICDMVTAVVDQASLLAEKNGVWMRVFFLQSPIIADFDAIRVQRILRNLVVNAIEHAEAKPVEVTVGANSQAVSVVVRDYGIGMTSDEVEHVFDRFWRADPARARTTGGTGLGLAIAQEDAHLHGGWLQAWGQPGNGASFRLTLPLRAGIEIEQAPVELVPELPSQVLASSDKATDGAPRQTDPAALPDLSEFIS